MRCARLRFANLRIGQGVDEIVRFIQDKGGCMVILLRQPTYGPPTTAPRHDLLHDQPIDFRHHRSLRSSKAKLGDH